MSVRVAEDTPVEPASDMIPAPDDDIHLYSYPYDGTPFAGFGETEWVRYWVEYGTEQPNDSDHLCLALKNIMKAQMGITHIVEEQHPSDGRTTYVVHCQGTTSSFDAWEEEQRARRRTANYMDCPAYWVDRYP